MRKIGIACEMASRRISFFDPDTFTVVSQFALGLYFVDATITKDGRRAVAVTGTNLTLVEFNTQGTPYVEAKIPGISQLRDVDTSPDSRYAVAVDGRGVGNLMHSFDLQFHTVVSTISSNTQAVAISPAGNGLILAANNNQSGTVGIYNLLANGSLSYTGITVNSGASDPTNITFSPDGKYALIAHFEDNVIGVLDTSNPNNITLVMTVTTQTTSPQTIVAAPSGNKVYVLTRSSVEIYNFVSGNLSFDTLFAHNLLISNGLYLGFDQMALEPTTNHLFISASESNVLRAFTTDGQVVGTVTGIAALGGVAVGMVEDILRGITLF